METKRKDQSGNYITKGKVQVKGGLRKEKN